MTNHLHPATETIDGKALGIATPQNAALSCIERRVKAAATAGQIVDHVAAEIEAMCGHGLAAGPCNPQRCHDLMHRTAVFIIDSVILVDVQSAAQGKRDDEGDWSPVARTIPPENMRGIYEACEIVRSIEAAHGPLNIPLKWLREVINDPSWLQLLPRGAVAGRA